MAANAISGALRQLFGIRAPAGKYTNLTYTATAIGREEYKNQLGGGRETWDARGRFQLDLLRARGLLPTSTLLDIGCGPLRAGVQFIRYLDAGNYFGFDYNVSFITAAERAVTEHGLSTKQPSLVALSDFEMSGIRRTFDYAIAFSVLNHCSPSQRRLFFSNIGQCLAPGAKLFISHARWLKEADLERAGLVISERFGVHDLDLSEYGWQPPEQRLVCPLYELERRSG